MRALICLYALLLFALPLTAAAQDSLGYPSFRTTTPITVNASQIVIRGGQTHISAVRPIDRGRSTADMVERYLKARFRANGQGSQLVFNIRHADITDQGRTELGNRMEYINIELEASLAASDFHTTQKRAYVVSKRSTTGVGSRLGNLPIDSSGGDMKEVMENLDRRLLTALRHELGVLK